MNDYLSINQAKTLAQPYQTITKQCLFPYLREGRIPGKFADNIWWIESSFVTEAIAWRRTAFTISECISKYEEDHPEQKVTDLDQRQLVRYNKQLRSDSPFQLFFSGKHFIESDNLIKFMTMIDKQVSISHTKTESIPIMIAAEMMSTNQYRLHKAIIAGEIPAISSNNQWFLEKSVVTDYVQNRKLYCCVYDAAVSISKTIHTVFDPDDRSNRAALYKFLKSSLFKEKILEAKECGIIYEKKRSLFYPLKNATEIESLISQYLKSYGNSAERIQLYVNLSWAEKYPNTAKALAEYTTNQKAMITANLMNILVHNQIKEIMEYTNEELASLIFEAEKTSRDITKRHLLGFFNFIREHYECQYSQEFFIHTKSKKSTLDSVYPYTEQQFISVGIMAFSDNHIKQCNIIQKAIKNPRKSYTWYYTQMHYVGAFRKSDIDASMPILPLPYDPQETIRRISEGIFDDDAVKLSIRFESEFNESLIKPHKTQNSQNQRFMIMSIPTGMRKAFGICYAIYCFHKHTHKPFSTFLRGTSFLSLFGESYRKAIGDSVFLNRRANKSYLDFIAQDIEHKHGINYQIMGYKVSQFVRAHVRGSTSTSRYLSTKLDGFNIDDIALMLFETGTCSFIPHYLFQIIYGEKYSNASVEVQNNTILASKLTPFKSERLTKYLDDAFNRSQLAVESIMKSAPISMRKEIAKDVLHNLITRTSLGKSSGVNCLLAARRMPCAYLGRDCFGCIYGIYETSFFYLAIEYVKKQYCELNASKTIGESIKWQTLLDKETLPSMCEILSISETIYKMDVSEYKNQLLELVIAKGGIYNGTLEV